MSNLEYVDTDITDSSSRYQSYGIGDESDITLNKLMMFHDEFFSPMSRENESKISKFYYLADLWKKETLMSSSITDIVENTHYQDIIAIGVVIVPYILNELSREPDHWFWALTSITGVNPVTGSDRGNVKKMTDAWIAWGLEKGFL